LPALKGKHGRFTQTMKIFVTSARGDIRSCARQPGARFRREQVIRRGCGQPKAATQ
jgi:hypothetical protein